ncbi:hypothetical protein [Paracoccus sp. DMF]|uniref:hypothetical protein n=1 Tax=Paracoccus sp. DMF TaxID=400837 RepID=UPI0021E4E923|nr:hypothetical protein [Paracoccus sp. DMF]MCV2449432.1 hypothetical protein [Paracoccus sp. DMF]
MPQINKTLEYRRARFNTPGQNLEQLTRQAWGQFATHLERGVPRADRAIVTGMRDRDEGAWGFALHCARYYDRQGVGTIPMAPAAQVDLGERQPDAGENFLNADFLAMIRGNHVICLSCGRSGGALRSYLSGLFKKAGMPRETQFFELIRVGNPNALAIIERVGVRSIDMKVDISEASAVELIEGEGGGGFWQNAKRQIGEAFQGLTARDAELRQLRQSEQGSVTVSINVKKGDLSAAREGLDHLAGEIAEDEEADGYVIHLRDGAVIKPDEVSVKKPVRLEAHANSVSVFQAWDAMRTYMEELEGNGQLGA